MYMAKDVMTSPVISISADASVDEGIRTLLEHGISGAIVVGEGGTMVGIVSEFQLMEVIYNPDIRNLPVRNYMTKDVITVKENTLLAQVANVFIVHRIRRVPVMNGDEVVGLISRRDLLRYAMESADAVGQFIHETETFAAH